MQEKLYIKESRATHQYQSISITNESLRSTFYDDQSLIDVLVVVVVVVVVVVAACRAAGQTSS